MIYEPASEYIVLNKLTKPLRYKFDFTIEIMDTGLIIIETNNPSCKYNNPSGVNRVKFQTTNFGKMTVVPHK